MNELIRPSGCFAERMGQFLERVEYVRIDTAERLDAVLRLRYEAYLREGAIAPRPEKRIGDAFDASPNVFNFVVYVDGHMASALRLHVLSRAHPVSPAQACFADRLDPHLRAERIVIDPNRFVADYERARAYPQLPYATLRLGIFLADHVDADLITCTVRSEHRAFYRREYLAESVCDPRPYPTLTKSLGLMMLINFRRDREAILRRRGFYDSTAEERRRLFGDAPPRPAAARPQRIAEMGEM